MPNISAASSQMSQTDIFICRSSNDKEYYQELAKHFKYDTRQHNLNVWDESKMQPGSIWQQEMVQALQSARVAILFISADFFDSDFIVEHILPQLFDAVSQKNITIINVILGYCDFKSTKLAQFQPINLLSLPLATITQPEREEIWTKVAQQAREIIIEQTGNTFEGLFDPSEMLKTVARYFLQCRYMKDRRSREHVLRRLPVEILQEIDAFPIIEQDNRNTDLEEVFNLVTICSSYPDGLEKLAYAVYQSEHASLSWQELDKYLRKSGAKLITYTRLQELCAILKPVEWLDPLLSRIYRDSVPDYWDMLRNYHASNKLDLILEDLSKFPQQYDDTFPILEFAQRIAYQALERQERALHDALRKWVKERSRDLGLTKSQETAFHEKAKKQLQSAAFYLLLTLKPNSENTFCVQSWLFDDENSIIQNVNVESSDDLYSLENIADLLKDLLERCRSYLADEMENLIIEFFLPLELLSYPVDQYSIGDSSIFQSISRDYQVVVRSLERIEGNPKRPYIWKNKWKLFLDSIHEEQLLSKHKNAVLVYDEEQYKGQEDLLLALEASSVFCFAMTFVPSNHSSQIDDILSAVLEAKVPIVLWPRERTNYPKALHELFTELVSQHPLSQLPALIKQQRYEALISGDKQHHQGHHLTLLWDDPNRVPPTRSKQLVSASRRGA
jgi:hypothetical protein